MNFKNEKLPGKFGQVDKVILSNPKLSWAAKGMLAYLLSHPDNWGLILNNLWNVSSNGLDQNKALIKELIDHKHLVCVHSYRLNDNREATNLIDKEYYSFESATKLDRLLEVGVLQLKHTKKNNSIYVLNSQSEFVFIDKPTTGKNKGKFVYAINRQKLAIQENFPISVDSTPMESHTDGDSHRLDFTPMESHTDYINNNDSSKNEINKKEINKKEEIKNELIVHETKIENKKEEIKTVNPLTVVNQIPEPVTNPIKKEETAIQLNKPFILMKEELKHLIENNESYIQFKKGHPNHIRLDNDVEKFLAEFKPTYLNPNPIIKNENLFNDFLTYIQLNAHDRDASYVNSFVGCSPSNKKQMNSPINSAARLKSLLMV
jgi:hypothetical protein